MNREMKAALNDALSEILLMSPEEFLAEAKKAQDGDVYSFFMDSHKFADFDIKELEPLQIMFSEIISQKTIKCLSETALHESQHSTLGLEFAGYALAA
ncbi:hypothetical protein [Erwinia billingiae]|uniref:hypothetical protein n=1 Tax=Erwinia billingiae TaxID=182337 RepID=UPI00069EDA27|nr:hypothetical protein [Erwinia billingiae]